MYPASFWIVLSESLLSFYLTEDFFRLFWYSLYKPATIMCLCLCSCAQLPWKYNCQSFLLILQNSPQAILSSLKAATVQIALLSHHFQVVFCFLSKMSSWHLAQKCIWRGEAAGGIRKRGVCFHEHLSLPISHHTHVLWTYYGSMMWSRKDLSLATRNNSCSLKLTYLGFSNGERN